MGNVTPIHLQRERIKENFCFPSYVIPRDCLLWIEQKRLSGTNHCRRIYLINPEGVNMSGREVPENEFSVLFVFVDHLLFIIALEFPEFNIFIIADISIGRAER